MTLVEVLVAITVLSIIVFALLSTLVAMRKVVARQEEYVKIKMVCQDIDAYLKKYETSTNLWYKEYFGDGAVVENNKSENCYLTANFKPTSDESQAEYKVSFQCDATSITKFSIITKSKDRVLVSNLNFPLKNGGNNQ